MLNQILTRFWKRLEQHQPMSNVTIPNQHPDEYRSDPNVPGVPKLCRFKSSQPQFKFIRNHLDKATLEQARIGPVVNQGEEEHHPSPTDPWIGHHSTSRHGAIAILNRCIPDSAYDLLVFRLLSGQSAG
jgi:hypothetical protein